MAKQPAPPSLWVVMSDCDGEQSVSLHATKKGAVDTVIGYVDGDEDDESGTWNATRVRDAFSRTGQGYVNASHGRSFSIEQQKVQP